jgi:hypothetical protein
MKKSTIKLARPLLILAVLAVMAVAVMSIGASADGAADTSAPSGRTQSYVVLMEGKSLVAYEGDIKGLPATKPN